MNKFIVLIISLSSVLFFGCSQAETVSSRGETVAAETITQVPDDQIAKPLTPAAADALIAATIEAINQENVNFFMPYLMERDRASENVQAALEHYQAYFQGEEITDFERLGVEQLGKTGDKTPIQRFNYRIFTPSGMSNSISVYQDQSIRLDDQFLLYSVYANRLVERYFDAIQSQDIEKLGKFLNLEGTLFSQEDLRGIISKYEDLFSLDSLNYQFTDLESDRQQFIYTLSGKNGREHEIKVIYGDGLVSLHDNFIPAKN
ncbi:MAG: hypothetical protein RLO19_29955 [Coleofasciculus sp. G2-EDA-02]